jgi:hypothetical protein
MLPLARVELAPSGSAVLMHEQQHSGLFKPQNSWKALRDPAPSAASFYDANVCLTPTCRHWKRLRQQGGLAL